LGGLAICVSLTGLFIDFSTVLLYNKNMTTNSHHVVPAPKGGWNVIKSGAERASKHFKVKKDAEEWARQVSINQQSALYIHKRDGTIQSKDSYGNNPQPPVDHR
jgi:hypothetical protein